MNGGVSTAIEYAVLALGVHHIIVCGHSDCGAMRAVLDPQTLERMPTVKAWLRHAEVARTVVADNCDCGASHDTLGVLTEENVVAQLDHLRTHPRWPRAWPAGNCSSTAGCTTSSAQIRAYDAKQGRFLPLDGEHPVPMATPAPRYLNS